MAKKVDPFVMYVIDMLQGFGSVRSRAMFGGYGLYYNGYMFALIADGILYMKADDKNRARFEAEELERFSYTRQDKRYFMSYYKLPESAIEDAEELVNWAQEGYAAASR